MDDLGNLGVARNFWETTIYAQGIGFKEICNSSRLQLSRIHNYSRQRMTMRRGVLGERQAFFWW